MKFTTPVPIISREPKIDHHSRIFLTGSCFVENIGEKLDYYKLHNFRNPFGILYHPAAIKNLLEKVNRNYRYTSEDVFFHNERWHCFDVHSALSASDKETLLQRLNENLQNTLNYLKEASHVIITPGTSWVYRNVASQERVANCHKVPQKNFSRELTSPSEVQFLLSSVVSEIQSINPGTKIIFTVSPVRHIKDGIIENQLSKAHLLTAVHAVIKDFPESAFYFPAYEIVMDELRDYRFFAEDMIHPNAIAVKYIWEKFSEAWFSPEAILAMNTIEEIRKALSHRPFDEGSAAHQKFLISTQKKIAEFNQQYPEVTF